MLKSSYTQKLNSPGSELYFKSVGVSLKNFSKKIDRTFLQGNKNAILKQTNSMSNLK